MRAIPWLFLGIVLVASAGCEPRLGRETVRVDGTVHYFDLEGGFWAIKGDDGKTYDPMGGVPADYQKDGLRVHLVAKVRPDVGSIHMAGVMVEIISIRRI
jgi:hypothetical protein